MLVETMAGLKNSAERERPLAVVAMYEKIIFPKIRAKKVMSIFLGVGFGL